MSEPFLGQIMAFGFNFPPRGWSTCEGQILPIAQNTALFSLLGTTFGGDGRTTFALPDLRGRSIVGQGQGPGLADVNWGEKSGAATKTLATAELPAHTHPLVGTTSAGNTGSPTGKTLASAEDANRNPLNLYGDGTSATMATSAIGNTGNGQSFSLRNPYLGLYYNIALIGLFPSRN